MAPFYNFSPYQEWGHETSRNVRLKDKKKITLCLRLASYRLTSSAHVSRLTSRVKLRNGNAIAQ